MSRLHEEMKETLDGVDRVLGKVYKTEITLEGYVILPDELLKELGWKEGDELKFETTDVCEETFEHEGIVVSNITKNKRLNDENSST